MASILKVPTKDEIKTALEIPKATPPLDRLGRRNTATTPKALLIERVKREQC
jgi:hypothetical protein